MDNTLKTRPSSEERIWAALAHIFVLMFGFGLIAPLVVWFSQRGKSAYARFQALQALSYQVFMSVLMFVLGMTITVVVGIVMASVAIVGQNSRTSFPEVFFILPQLLIFGLLFGGGLLYIGTGILGAILCLTGRNFRYPLLGNWLQRFLEAGELDDREARWVAALCHASVVTFMAGAIVPLVTWITQKDRSPLLRFQALQALVYQLAGLLGYILINGVWFVGWFGMLMVLFVGSALTGGHNAEMNSIIGVVFILGFALMMTVMLIMLACGPLYLIVAYWGAVRTLQGRDFRYPLLGRWIAARLESNPVSVSIPAAEGTA